MIKNKRSNKIGTCRLCKQPNIVLHKESHIFPKWMYKRMINEEKGVSFYLGVTPDKQTKLIRAKTNSGITEDYIFCVPCEKLFSNHDNWGAQFFDNKFAGSIGRQNVIGEKGESMFHYTGLNYKEYKLFILSLFLRASLCELELMKSLKFTDDTESKLCNMVLENDPGLETDFPVLKVFHHRHPNELSSHITFPITMQPHIHSFFYNNSKLDGIMYSLITDLSAVPPIFTDNYLKEDGSMWVLILSDVQRDELYKNILNIPIDKAFLPEKKYLLNFVPFERPLKKIKMKEDKLNNELTNPKIKSRIINENKPISEEHAGNNHSGYVIKKTVGPSTIGLDLKSPDALLVRPWLYLSYTGEFISWDKDFERAQIYKTLDDAESTIQFSGGEAKEYSIEKEWFTKEEDQIFKMIKDRGFVALNSNNDPLEQIVDVPISKIKTRRHGKRKK